MPSTFPISLDAGSATPLYRQVEDSLRRAILDGVLRPGDRLPPIRQLAADLRIARTTVVSAYDQLTAEGYLTALVGSGTRVARELPDDRLRVPWAGAPFRPGEAAARRPSSSAIKPRLMPPLDPRLPTTPYRLAGQSIGLPFDFSPSRPGFDLFPFELWERLLRSAWRDLEGSRGASLDYPDPAGLPRLRWAIADHLRSARAVRCTPEQVVITSGSQAAFDAAVRLWLGPGRSCIVEDPGYLMARRVILASGAKVVSRLVDTQGLVTARLPVAAEMVLVTPSWQYPLGGTLPIGRRLELLRWAREAGAVVIEDDYDSELRYEGHPLASLQGLDEDGRVLYVGTLSKVAFPGLRLGYAVVPAPVGESFVAALELSHRGLPALEQLALARFIEEGHLDRHLRRTRVAYAERQAALLDALRHELSGRVLAAPAAAGMHLVARLTDGAPTATATATAARARGAVVVPMGPRRIAPAPDDELLLGYTGLTPSQIRDGVRELAAAIRQ